MEEEEEEVEEEMEEEVRICRGSEGVAVAGEKVVEEQELGTRAGSLVREEMMTAVWGSSRVRASPCAAKAPPLGRWLTETMVAAAVAPAPPPPSPGAATPGKEEEEEERAETGTSWGQGYEDKDDEEEEEEEETTTYSPCWPPSETVGGPLGANTSEGRAGGDGDNDDDDEEEEASDVSSAPTPTPTKSLAPPPSSLCCGCCCSPASELRTNAVVPFVSVRDTPCWRRREGAGPPGWRRKGAGPPPVLAPPRRVSPLRMTPAPIRNPPPTPPPLRMSWWAEPPPEKERMGAESW